ncbi:VWA domain-containing protein [Bacillus sp. FJAT-29790]|uniref:vWA domain-containing protein n=1 Tax=Bacillus sp. FJAT-29790 TaxID=1895002 RepID=UPI001C22B460|nr:VWA domain-containing protein [Bacillus sp. FJAT-29790]MBU8881374.1 VWA domain-containing protein [Bacillus sp. FJAT-29790]
MYVKRKFLWFVMSMLVIAGCSKETEIEKKITSDPASTEIKNEQNEIEIVIEELETTVFESREIEDILRQGPGKYYGENYDEEKVKQAIGEFPKDLSQEEYFTRLLALTAEDYRSYYDFFNQVDTSYEDPNAEPGEMETGAAITKRVNVEILLDSSGSMKAQIGGKSKMEHAKSAIQTFVSELPSNVNVSLRVYGHLGTGSNQDKAASCNSSEIVYPLSAFDQEQFSASLNKFSPAGWTPLAASIAAANFDLKEETGEETENIIYIVSDGVETCGGNPVEEAKKLNESNVKAVVNIIGFDVDNEGQAALKKIAEAGKGKYSAATSQKSMEDFFRKEKQRLINEWYDWQNKNVNKYYDSQNTRVNELYDVQNEMVNQAYKEQERLLELAHYFKEKTGIDSFAIREAARDRGFSLREYARDTAYNFRETLRKDGYENREKVRSKGQEEREKLRSEE